MTVYLKLIAKKEAHTSSGGTVTGTGGEKTNNCK